MQSSLRIERDAIRRRQPEVSQDGDQTEGLFGPGGARYDWDALMYVKGLIGNSLAGGSVRPTACACARRRQGASLR